jgi:hypothetical protein
MRHLYSTLHIPRYPTIQQEQYYTVANKHHISTRQGNDTLHLDALKQPPASEPVDQ